MVLGHRDPRDSGRSRRRPPPGAIPVRRPERPRLAGGFALDWHGDWMLALEVGGLPRCPESAGTRSRRWHRCGTPSPAGPRSGQSGDVPEIRRQDMPVRAERESGALGQPHRPPSPATVLGEASCEEVAHEADEFAGDVASRLNAVSVAIPYSSQHANARLPAGPSWANRSSCASTVRIWVSTSFLASRLSALTRSPGPSPSAAPHRRPPIRQASLLTKRPTVRS